MLASESAHLIGLHVAGVKASRHYRNLSIKCQNASSEIEGIGKDTRLECCTFGGGNKQWLSQELPRLLSMQIIPMYPSGKPKTRCDGYWPAYITRAGESVAMKVILDIQSSHGRRLHDVQAVRLELEYICYGPHGRSSHAQHLVLPLSFPPIIKTSSRWQEIEGLGYIMPIHTHLLSHLDDPLQIIQMYALPHWKAGDIIAIGETPLAIMQGRFRHPRGIQPGLVAKLACRCFLPTSSLATACGMQCLIDTSGRLRVIIAVIIAVVARLIGIRGMFYRIAGDQARLIDDVSGTLPPYDQYIIFGPIHLKATVNALKAKTGCETAVVDVNDLRQVHILAASDGVNDRVLKAALRDNPAGNADEQTPLVLIRPKS